MRVISGKYRGKRLYAPKDNKVRPTTDRIKETLFNILQMQTAEATVLDLFCGSGALGIESLSRGAKEVFFVDKNKDSIDLTNQNLKGVEKKYKVIFGDFLTVLRSLHRKFDLIFIDPPYASELGELAIKAIFDLDALNKDGIIVYEHGSDKKFELKNKKYKFRTKVMGSVTVEFISHKTTALVTGSFDPITKGHEAVIDEAARYYDEVVVACLVNPKKEYKFNNKQRLNMVQATVENKKNVWALYSEKDAVIVAKEVEADILVRGIRGNQDLKYEKEMAEFNRKYGFETEFITIDRYKEVSSSIVKKEIDEGNFKNLPSGAIQVIMNMNL